MSDPKPTDWGNLHADLVEKFRASEDASRYTREAAERDIDYYDHKQLTEEEVRELKKRGQPPIVRNKIRAKVNYLLGLEQSMRTDPRALPRTPQHEEDANSATDALRFVCDQARFDQVRSAAFKDVTNAGWGGVEVQVRQIVPERNPRIVVERTPWDRMFWDPHSAAQDFSDAEYLGLIRWMDRQEAVRQYGDDAGKVFDETVLTGEIGGTYDDKPREWTWRSGKRDRVRVVQMYYRDADGVWSFCEFTGGGILNAGPSPWLGDDGQPEHGFAWRVAYRDRSNNPYGEIRGMIDTQDEINKRASKALHAINSRQTFGEEGSLGNMTTRQMRQELAKPDGHISMRPGKEFGKHFGVVPTNDITSGNLEMLNVALADMTVLGPNAAMQGKGASSASGRSILAQQQGGSIEAQGLFDILRDMDHEVYRKVWRRIRQFWTAEEWVRVTDDQRNLRWVGLNQPTMDPMTGQVVLQNSVADLDVDIIIDDAPHVGTLEGEQFQGMVELAKISPELQQLPAEAWITMSNLRNKGEALRMVQQARESRQPPPPDPMQQAAVQLEMENKQADTAQKAANAAYRQAQAAREAVGSQVDVFQAVSQPPQLNGNVIPFAG
ncbi:hypothetical protein J2X36_002139 [Methylobacterium sp. BE186]|uniref:portal protein n=1 Tax=Methylobacterium sp. BE186 TaxID=2817715 RepID=UPI002854FA13|nr:hypothetical protein [Methylobacterium sp. BE186]MDR7037392.1 hypothetical protein [Methylobacterium sp. BE186]